MMTHFPDLQDGDVVSWRRTQSQASSRGLTLCPGQEEPKQRTTEEMDAVRKMQARQEGGFGQLLRAGDRSCSRQVILTCSWGD